MTHDKTTPAIRASRLERLVMRLKAACHTNEPQVTATVLFTLMTLAACAMREHPTPWQLWVACAAFWPATVFVLNLISPIPRDDA